ncbi:14005_t:CDS:2 [Dentiscutata heterogama]|uniref:14005_t:CDS:1 n=1 Tax=Dentiscutata heterogama TaxID=1316150 RepID=A0ACA9M0F8_9GLOM|nr:14005_t:CDS:2 [Dentiscutata heterogama]
MKLLQEQENGYWFHLQPIIISPSSNIITNAQNELNYINQTVSESEFEQVIEYYEIMVEFDNDMFNNNIEDEELDADYIF